MWKKKKLYKITRKNTWERYTQNKKELEKDKKLLEIQEHQGVGRNTPSKS